MKLRRQKMKLSNMLVGMIIAALIEVAGLGFVIVQILEAVKVGVDCAERSGVYVS